MAWWNDYDRGYSNRYDRGGMYGGGSDRGPRGRDTGFYGGESTGRYRSTGSRGSVYGYDYGYARDYRVAPEESPSYGRSGDEQVRRWARTHGYDEGMEISPRPGSRGMGGYSSEQRPRSGGWQSGNRGLGDEGRGGAWQSGNRGLGDEGRGGAWQSGNQGWGDEGRGGSWWSRGSSSGPERGSSGGQQRGWGSNRDYRW
jgi:hypothetical protein